MKPVLINDPRLTLDMERARDGRMQLFSRNRFNNEFPSTDNADVVLQHEKTEYYARLIDGEWYWVSGCSACGGSPRYWLPYVECEKHNVCKTCSIKRSELVENAYATSDGWQCKPCHDADCLALKIDALTKMSEKRYHSCDYLCKDEIVCPHCDHSYEYDSGESPPEGIEECDLCGGLFNVEPNYEVTFSTSIVGERVTLSSIKDVDNEVGEHEC